jgi:phosphatidate cytidylyltransferase
LFAQRLAVAAIAIPIIVVLVWVGGAAFDIALAIVLAITAVEFFQMARGQWRTPMALATALAAGGLVFAADEGYDWLVYGLAIVAVVSLVVLVATSDIEAGYLNWSAFTAAVVYVGFLGAHFALLRDADEGRYLVLFVLLGTYIVDSVAYAAGKTMGRHRFTPRISPGKTWEGTAACLLLGPPALVLLALLLDIDWDTLEIVGVALLFPAFAVAGDLAESVLKRSLQLKDTSQLIPGHGGLVDRIDSLLFTAALAFYWLVWVVE